MEYIEKQLFGKKEKRINKNHMELQEDKQVIQTMARGAGIVFIGTILARLVGYFLRVAMKRYLGLADFGLVSSAIALVEIASVLALLGLPVAITRYIAYYQARKDLPQKNSVIVTGFNITLIASVLVGLAIFIFAPFFSNVLFKKPEILPILKVFWIAVIPFSLTFTISAIFRGQRQMSLMMLIQPLGRNTFVLLGFGLLALSGFGLDAAVYGNLAGFFITAILGIYLLFKTVKWRSQKQLNHTNIVRELLSYSWPLVFSSIFWNMSAKIDVFFLTIYVSREQVGVYSALLPISQFIPVAMLSFMTIFMPIISSYIARDNWQQIQSIYAASTKWIYIFTLLLFFPIFVFSGPILNLCFGADTLSGTFALQIIAFGYLIHAVLGPCNQLLHAAAKTKLVLVNTAFSFVTNIVLDLILIPKYGITGAAVAGTIAFLLVNLTALVENYYLYKIHPFTRPFITNLVISSSLYVLIIFVKSLADLPTNLTSMVILSVVFVILYFVILFLVRNFDENDLIVIEAIERKFNMNLNFLKQKIT